MQSLRHIGDESFVYIQIYPPFLCNPVNNPVHPCEPSRSSCVSHGGKGTTGQPGVNPWRLSRHVAPWRLGGAIPFIPVSPYIWLSPVYPRISLYMHLSPYMPIYPLYLCVYICVSPNMSSRISPRASICIPDQAAPQQPRGQASHDGPILYIPVHPLISHIPAWACIPVYHRLHLFCISA